MIAKIVSALMNWLVNFVVIPISLVVIDYFRMKKTIKQTNEEINALKKALTAKEKDEAIDNMP